MVEARRKGGRKERMERGPEGPREGQRERERGKEEGREGGVNENWLQ